MAPAGSRKEVIQVVVVEAASGRGWIDTAVSSVPGSAADLQGGTRGNERRDRARGLVPRGDASARAVAAASEIETGSSRSEGPRRWGQSSAASSGSGPAADGAGRARVGTPAPVSGSRGSSRVPQCREHQPRCRGQWPAPDRRRPPSPSRPPIPITRTAAATCTSSISDWTCVQHDRRGIAPPLPRGWGISHAAGHATLPADGLYTHGCVNHHR